MGRADSSPFIMANAQQFRIGIVLETKLEYLDLAFSIQLDVP
jgi:hypothetical protein